MGKISLEDQAIMNEIIDVSKLIGNIYQRLFFEESEGNKHSSNYESLLNTLNIYKEMENDLYEQLNLTSNMNKLEDLIDYILNTEKAFRNYETRSFAAIYIENIEELNCYRIMNRITESAYSSDKDWCQWLLKENCFFTVKDALRYVSFKRLEYAMESDFENVFYNYLKETLDEELIDEEKDLYARIKYNLSYMSNNVEKEFIRTSDEAQEEIYFTFYFISDLYKINKRMVEDSQFENSQNYVSKGLRHITVKDEYVDEDMQQKFKLFSLYIKSGISLLYNLDDSESLIDEIADVIIEMNEDTNDNMMLVTDYLLNEIGDLGQDKNKCKYLRFVPKK